MKGYVSEARKKAAIPFYIICLCLAAAIVGSLIGWKVFRARDYAALLPVEDGDFAADVAEISFDQIPMLDSARRTCWQTASSASSPTSSASSRSTPTASR